MQLSYSAVSNLLIFLFMLHSFSICFSTKILSLGITLSFVCRSLCSKISIQSIKYQVKHLYCFLMFLIMMGIKCIITLSFVLSVGGTHTVH